MSAPWVTYRPEIKVLDCTIRDGGLMNDHLFEDGTVLAVYRACAEAGIDYMELGYKNSKKLFAPDVFGAWKHCDEDAMRRIVGDNPTDLKLSAMADAGKSDYKEDIQPREQSVLDMIRVATYIHQIPLAVDMINDAHQKGYETTVNLMAISTVSDAEIDQALEVLAETPVRAIYLVDSFGSLYSEQIEALTKKYLAAAKPQGKEVGIHAHNNQQLAYANTIEGIVQGANYVDATMLGIGRGAGNCPIELLVGFLRNPKFKIRPIYRCIQEHFEPLRDKITWGYEVPYGITAQLNRHPRAAIQALSGDERPDYADFYDQCSVDE